MLSDSSRVSVGEGVGVVVGIGSLSAPRVDGVRLLPSALDHRLFRGS